MVEILSFGGIKFLLGKLIEKICNKYCLDTLYKNDPELVYYEREKKESISNAIIKNILLYLLYCLPGLGTIIFLLYGTVSVINCCVTKTNVDELSVKVRTKRFSPSNKIAEMDNTRMFYDSKSITDSLILDGADDVLERLVVHMNLMYSSGKFERSKIYRIKK